MLPDLLSDVIDELVTRVAGSGYSTGRAQVVAGLIYAARARSAEEIEGLVRDYLISEVSSVVGDGGASGVVSPLPTVPGRRPGANR